MITCPRHAIVTTVAQKHGLVARDLFSNCRHEHISAARDEAIGRIKAELRDSKLNIGLFFERDSSTIWAALNREKKRTIERERQRRYRAV